MSEDLLVEVRPAASDDDTSLAELHVRSWQEAYVGQLPDRGFAEVTLWVLDSNARARRFYELGGWSQDGSTKAADIGGVTVTEVRYRRSIV